MKIRNIAILLAIFFGSLGFHRFYLKQWRYGFAYLLFCFTLIPFIISIIDAFVWAFWSKEKWDSKFNSGQSSLDYVNKKYPRQQQKAHKIATNDSLSATEKIIEDALKQKKPASINVSLLPHEYDLLASKYPKQHLYMFLPVKVKFKANPSAKTYTTAIEKIGKKYSIDKVIEDDTIFNVVETTVEGCQSSSLLSSTLKYTRNTIAIYRGKEYPYPEFKNAVYRYKTNEIQKIEEYFKLEDKNTVEVKIEAPIPIFNTRTNTKTPISTIDYDFVAIDFETSNRQHSICSVGIVGVKDGEIVLEKHWYVCPSSPKFENWNVITHGITYEKVKDEPSFSVVWEELSQYVVGQKLVAHNAANTDITCLRKAFAEYNINPATPLTNYECTLKLARTLLPYLENHKLPTLAHHFEIESFNHHDALEDARVCAKVYLELKKIERTTNVYSVIQKKKSDKAVQFYKGNQPKANLDNISFWSSTELDKDFFCEKNVVVTGEFLERESFESTLVSIGANIKNTINSKTDIVIIGNNPGWRKIETVKELISNGQDIIIIEASEIELLFMNN